MQYNRSGNDIVLRLDPGEEITSCVLAAAKKENVTCASVTAIGATNDFTVGVFDLNKKSYDLFRHNDGNYEIASLSGNLSALNGEPYQHLHMVCAGGDGRVAAGHLISAVISLTAEIMIHVIDMKAERVKNPEIGFNQLII